MYKNFENSKKEFMFFYEYSRNSIKSRFYYRYNYFDRINYFYVLLQLIMTLEKHNMSINRTMEFFNSKIFLFL